MRAGRIRNQWRIFIKNITREQVGTWFLTAGFLAGVYVGTCIEAVGFPKEDVMSFFEKGPTAFSVVSQDYFYFLLDRRCKQLLLLLCVPTMMGGTCAFLGMMELYGMGIGMYLAGLMKWYSMKGLSLFLVSFFPQAFFYMPCTCLALEFGLHYMQKRKNAVKYDKEALAGQKSGSPAVRKLHKNYRQSPVVRLLMILLLEFLGILTESFVNPGLMEGFLS